MRDQLNDQITDVVDRLKIDDQLRKATDNALQTNDRYFDAVLDTNRRVIEFAVNTADRVIDGTPEFPYDLPFVDRMPSPTEAGDRYLEFVERAVEANREFNERVIKMLEVERPAPKPRSPRKASTTAGTGTAKKSKRARRPKAAASEPATAETGAETA